MMKIFTYQQVLPYSFDNKEQEDKIKEFIEADAKSAICEHILKFLVVPGHCDFDITKEENFIDELGRKCIRYDLHCNYNHGFKPESVLHMPEDLLYV